MIRSKRLFAPCVLSVLLALAHAGCQTQASTGPASTDPASTDQASTGQASGPEVSTATREPGDGSPRDGSEPSYRDIVVTATTPPPAGWTRQPPLHVAASQTVGIGNKLGGRILDLWNTDFQVNGNKLKVNTIECASDDDARQIEAALRKIHGNPAFSVRDGRTVIEFVGGDIQTIVRAAYELRIKPQRVDYRVAFRAAPLADGDYMRWNLLFNRFLQLENGDPQAAAQIEALADNFSFGSQLAFRRMGMGDTPSKFELQPASPARGTSGDGEIVTYTFDELPRLQGIPQVRVVATIRCEAFAMTSSDRQAKAELLSANKFWPSDDANIANLARQIIGDAKTTQKKTQALLEWLMPGRNIRYDGKVTGSRYGVRQLLEQKYGHCWDFSDCFVTLARASGIPSRQVFGWLVDQSGHVWAEVLIEGKGWMQVDPTAGMQCTADYIPFIASEDGQMPMVYTSAVTIQRLPGKQ